MSAETLEICFQLVEFENLTRERSIKCSIFTLSFIILIMLTTTWCVHKIHKWNTRHPCQKINSAYFEAHRSPTLSSHGLRLQQQEIYFCHKEKVFRSWDIRSHFFGPNFSHLSRLNVSIVTTGKMESSAGLGVTPGSADVRHRYSLVKSIQLFNRLEKMSYLLFVVVLQLLAQPFKYRHLEWNFDPTEGDREHLKNYSGIWSYCWLFLFAVMWFILRKML